MIVKTGEGQEFAGATAEAVVRQMRDTEWNAPEKKRDYMEEVAERVFNMTGLEIPSPTTIPASEFLQYLERAGLVTVEQ